MIPGGPLIEASRDALRAASIGDMAALDTALMKRRAALADASPFQLAAAFNDGESLRMLLKGIKRRIRDQHRQLEQIKMGLARTAAPRAAKIDLRA